MSSVLKGSGQTHMTEEACNGMAFDRLHLMGHSNVLGDSKDLTETYCKQNQMQQHLEGRNLDPFRRQLPTQRGSLALQ